jgi:tetratricopeptide (TPR) repeat protein
MAPEQHLGHDVDARADQFSFCLSLYEALYGTAAFADPQASIDGRIEEPPPTARVPRWLRHVLLHGLAPKPESRYQSMDALLSALARDPSIGWRKRAVAASVVLLIAAAAIVERKSTQSHSQLCKGAEHRLAGIWDDGVRERTRRAIVATGDRSASQVWSSLRDALDEYARNWAASHTEACLETRVRGEQSENVLALKMACFDTRLNEMSALVGELQTPDRELVQHAVESTSHLSSLRQCTDVAALTAAVPPPNADAAARVDALRRRIAEAHAYNISGRYDKGLAVVTAIVADARKLAYKPVLAQALDEEGDLLTRAGKSAAAEPLLVDAFAAAYASNDHVRVAQAASHLVGAVGVWQGRKTEGHHWAELGLAAVDRLGGNDELRADLLSAKASIHIIAGENGPEAVALATEALALLERTTARDSLPVALAHGRLGSAYSIAHNIPAALAEKEHALQLLTRLLGPTHPHVAAVLTNLCDSDVLAGRYDVAIALGRRALAIHEGNLGPEHPSIGIDLVNLGTALEKAGQCSAAVEHFRRAVTIGERASSDVIQSEARRGLGSCLRQLGRPGEARLVLERTLAACEQRHDSDCVAAQRYELAQVFWDLHEPTRAIALARESAVAGSGDSPERVVAVKKWLDEHVHTRR